MLRPFHAKRQLSLYLHSLIRKSSFHFASRSGCTGAAGPPACRARYTYALLQPTRRSPHPRHTPGVSWVDCPMRKSSGVLKQRGAQGWPLFVFENFGCRWTLGSDYRDLACRESSLWVVLWHCVLQWLGSFCTTAVRGRKFLRHRTAHTARALVEARKVILRVQRCLGAGMV